MGMWRAAAVAVAGALALAAGAASAADDAACPAAFKDLKRQAASAGAGAGAPITCVCPPGKPRGDVWGTGIYTQDSAICAAAVHAGVIPGDAGGTVSLQAAPGCNAYQGSRSNDIKSQSYGPWRASFTFANAPKACQ